MNPAFDSVKALTFDVFGTTVDHRGTIIAEGEALSRAKGRDVDWVDWPAFADAWRGGYKPAMHRVRTGELPWTPLDRLHRMMLDRLLADFHITGLSEAEIAETIGSISRVSRLTDPRFSDAPRASAPPATAQISSPSGADYEFHRRLVKREAPRLARRSRHEAHLRRPDGRPSVRNVRNRRRTPRVRRPNQSGWELPRGAEARARDAAQGSRLARRDAEGSDRSRPPPR